MNGRADRYVTTIVLTIWYDILGMIGIQASVVEHGHVLRTFAFQDRGTNHKPCAEEEEWWTRFISADVRDLGFLVTSMGHVTSIVGPFDTKTEGSIYSYVLANKSLEWGSEGFKETRSVPLAP